MRFPYPEVFLFMGSPVVFRYIGFFRQFISLWRKWDS